ncbi:MAG: UPF0182 family protein, partial [Chitinivibrionales bacterium]|nr:UPF0182 family protein [Chitinivibrionales bacterium]
MFTYIGFFFFLLGCIPLFLTVQKSSRVSREQFRKGLRNSAAVIIIDLLIIIAFNIFGALYTDLLWFENLGYDKRFWTVVGSRIILYAVGAVAAFVFVYLMMKTSTQKLSTGTPKYPAIIAVAVALIMGFGISGLWNEILLFVNRVPGEIKDPVYNKSTGFYLFTFPLFSAVLTWLFSLIIVTLIAVIGGRLFGFIGTQAGKSTITADDFQQIGSLRGHLFFLASLFLAAMAANSYLAIFRLMYSTEGVVNGVGYVDIHYRRLAYIVAMVVYAVCSLSTLLCAFSAKARSAFFGVRHNSVQWGKLFIIPGLAAAILIIVIGIVPGIVTSLVLTPNEITLEKPYINHNIKFTRMAYGIDDDNIIQSEYDAGRDITPSIVDQNTRSLENIRLWDPRALIDNLKEQQEIRLYYEFHDVDIDRYHFGNDYRQVMLSTRELAKNDLDPNSQTWVSRKLKYTHGYGLVLLPVHEFLPQGGPNLLIKNIPPQVGPREFTINRPGIYYGERTNDYVFVRTSQKEFHYPSGDENVYTTYEGRGGVGVGSFMRKVFYSWKFDDYRLLFSGYFSPESRVLFYRNIMQRVRNLAPFLVFDRDPYAFISKDGHIKYIIDAYTVSRNYPYSEKYTGDLAHFYGVNYIRNSVKAVVDAYDGSVEFYIVNEDDVVISTYARIFPGLLKPMGSMPDDIQAHIRYPVDFLVVQSQIYSTYHMEDPAVFYQREDVWQFATERYRDNFQTVDPYYVMVDYPEEDGIVFSLIMPFTPRNKNVINAWMAGICDMPDYGKLRVFTFPKGVEVLGPRQIEARLDQDTEMSQAMTLWGQRGSRVIRGNLLAIPLFDKKKLYILYAEPIFLQAEDAQLPEIKRIALA